MKLNRYVVEEFQYTCHNDEEQWLPFDGVNFDSYDNPNIVYYKSEKEAEQVMATLSTTSFLRVARWEGNNRYA